MVFSKLWELFADAKATTETLGYLVNEFAIRFFESDLAVNLFGMNATFETVKERYALLPYLLMLFGLLEAFFGRRFIKTQKLFFGFIVGFAIGAVYIAPEVSYVGGLSPAIIGLAFGIVLALFRSPLYFATVTFTVFYLFYYQMVNRLGFVKFISLVLCALIAAFVVIFLLRFLELVGTAMLGGWIFAGVLSWGVKFSPANKEAIITVITVIIAIIGFTVQFVYERRMRKKKIEEI